MGVTIVSVKPVKAKTAGDTGTGRVADQPADEEAGRAAYQGASGRPERAVEQPLAGARRCRYQ
jgi:hypothetical protein